MDYSLSMQEMWHKYIDAGKAFSVVKYGNRCSDNRNVCGCKNLSESAEYNTPVNMHLSHL